MGFRITFVVDDSSGFDSSTCVLGDRNQLSLSAHLLKTQFVPKKEDTKLKMLELRAFSFL